MRPFYRAMKAAAHVGGAACLLLVIAAGILTVIDVAIRKTAGGGILGTTDWVQLLTMAAAFAAIPYGFFAESHVSVDLLTDGLRPGLLALVKAAGALVGVGLLVTVAWAGWDQLALSRETGAGSPTIGLPMSWYWWPFMIGTVWSAVAGLAVACRYLGIALGRGDVAG